MAVATPAIDCALRAKEKGAKVLGISSSDWHQSIPKDFPIRHKSGKNLFDIADICIDGNDPMVAHRNLAKKTVSLARQNNKPSQRWIQSFFRSPEDPNTLKDICEIYSEEGVDSIFSWTYRAVKGTLLQAPDPDAVWEILGKPTVKCWKADAGHAEEPPYLPPAQCSRQFQPKSKFLAASQLRCCLVS